MSPHAQRGLIRCGRLPALFTATSLSQDIVIVMSWVEHCVSIARTSMCMASNPSISPRYELALDETSVKLPAIFRLETVSHRIHPVPQIRGNFTRS